MRVPATSDIETGKMGDAAREIAMSLVYFARNDAALGTELFVSDGTPGAPRLVKDLRPGLGSASPGEFVAYGGRLAFAADDGVNGRELWTTDGSAAGTRRSTDIVPGLGGSNPSDIVVLDRELYFSATTATGARELWASYGAANEAFRIKDSAGLLNNSPRDLIVSGSAFYFLGSSQTDQLWKSLGSAGNTAPVIVPDFYVVRDLTNVNGRLFFTTNNTGANGAASTGRGLWITDAANGVRNLTNYGPGDRFSSLTASGDYLFALLERGTSLELVRSDGTSQGTAYLHTFPGESAYAGGIASAGRGIVTFFAVTNAPDVAPKLTLWRSDGTATGTVSIGDLPGQPLGVASENINGSRFFTVLNGTSDAPVLQLWKTDATAVGTTLVSDLPPALLAAAAAGGGIGMTANDGALHLVTRAADNTSSLWESDGTSAGTVMLASGLASDVSPVVASSARVYLQSAVTGQVIDVDLVDGKFAGYHEVSGATGPVASGYKAFGHGAVSLGRGDETFIQSQATGDILYASHGAAGVTYGVVVNGIGTVWKGRAVADVNGDGTADAIIQNEADGSIYYVNMRNGVFSGFGSVTGPLGPVGTTGWIVRAAGDITGDGYADVVIENQTSGAIYWADMAGGTFQKFGFGVGALPKEWNAVGVRDFVAGRGADIVIQHETLGSTYTIHIENSTFKNFGNVVQSITPQWHMSDVVDMDLDGTQDFVFQNVLDGTVVFKDGFTGKFEAVSPAIGAEWLVVG